MGRSDPKAVENSVAERLAARERVILDREVELYRLRQLAFPAGELRRRRLHREPRPADEAPASGE